MSVTAAALVLADGTTFEGEAMGAGAPDEQGHVLVPVASGEVVFNTVMSGYQELSLIHI